MLGPSSSPATRFTGLAALIVRRLRHAVGAFQRWRLPKDVWSLKATVLVLVLIAGPPLAAFQFTPYATDLSDQADIVGLFVYPVALTAALHLYFHWRLTEDVAAGRLATMMFAGAVQGLSMLALRIGYPEAVESHVVRLFAVDLLFAIVALSLVVVRPWRVVEFDPGALGVALGLGVCALRFAIVPEPHSWLPGPVVMALLYLFLFGLHLAIAVAVLRLRPLPGWVRSRLALAFVLLSINRALAYPWLSGDVTNAIAIATDLAGAVLLCSTTVALLRRTTRRRQQEIAALYRRIDEVENNVAGDRERLHEIGATVAGIACATELMHDRHLLPIKRREQLEQMVDSEIARLARLMENRRQESREFDLDRVIDPLVTAQHAAGQQVRFVPTGKAVHARPDDVAEVVHVLLENAARHAPGAPVTITSMTRDDAIEVRVHDAGPGIPREMADRVFGRGWHGRESSGQGIGLHVASRLMDAMGGSLRLLPTRRGTTFVVTMPKARAHHDASTAAAQ